jgi:hypothetical protein
MSSGIFHPFHAVSVPLFLFFSHISGSQSATLQRSMTLFALVCNVFLAVEYLNHLKRMEQGLSGSAGGQQGKGKQEQQPLPRQSGLRALARAYLSNRTLVSLELLCLLVFPYPFIVPSRAVTTVTLFTITKVVFLGRVALEQAAGSGSSKDGKKKGGGGKVALLALPKLGPAIEAGEAFLFAQVQVIGYLGILAGLAAFYGVFDRKNKALFYF